MYQTGKKGTTIGQLISQHSEASEELCAAEFRQTAAISDVIEADVLHIEQFASLLVILLVALLFSAAGTMFQRRRKKAAQKAYESKKMSYVSTSEFRSLMKQSIESTVYPKLNRLIAETERRADSRKDSPENNEKASNFLNPLFRKRSMVLSS